MYKRQVKGRPTRARRGDDVRFRQGLSNGNELLARGDRQAVDALDLAIVGFDEERAAARVANELALHATFALSLIHI